MMDAFRLENGDYNFVEGGGGLVVSMTLDELADFCKQAIMTSTTKEENRNALRALIFHEASKILRDHCDYRFMPGKIWMRNHEI